MSKTKQPIEMSFIVCGCGKRILFAARKEAVKPLYITCRGCGKKHFV